MRITILLLLGLLVTVEAHAETVYVSDMLRVGVRTEPGTDGAPISVVVSGMELEVLERKGNYMRIRTKSGVEGWVNSAYATKQLPSRRIAENLEEEKTELNTQIAELNKKLTDAGNREAALAQKLQELTDLNMVLRERLQKNESGIPALPTPKSLPWWSWPVGFAVLLLIGFIIGVLWYRHRIVKKFHGLSP